MWVVQVGRPRTGLQQNFQDLMGVKEKLLSELAKVTQELNSLPPSR